MQVQVQLEIAGAVHHNDYCAVPVTQTKYTQAQALTLATASNNTSISHLPLPLPLHYSITLPNSTLHSHLLFLSHSLTFTSSFLLVVPSTGPWCPCPCPLRVSRPSPPSLTTSRVSPFFSPASTRQKHIPYIDLFSRTATAINNSSVRFHLTSNGEPAMRTFRGNIERQLRAELPRGHSASQA